MANPLVINSETGFLESPSPRSLNPERNFFNSERKLAFLALVDQAIEAERLPNIAGICRALGVGQRIVDEHIKQDKAFSQEWDERRRQLLSVYSSKLADKAESKMGTLANLAMLRWLESGTWNPETRVNHVTNNSESKSLISAIPTIIDGEIVANTGDIPSVLPSQGDAHK